MTSSLPQLRQLVKTPQIKSQFAEMLKDNSAAFLTSIITTVSNNQSLQSVSPNSIILCAATSASINLPVNPTLGYAAIIPYGDKAQLQIMVDGWVALAKRGGQLEVLTCEPVYEGELIAHDRFHEHYEFLDTGCEDENKVIGFMCYMKETNGFHKTIYWSKEKMLNHGKKYSKTFNSKSSLWKTNFLAMGRKTLIKHMLKKYGTLSIDMQKAMERDDRAMDGGDMTDLKDGEVTFASDDDSFVDAEEVSTKESKVKEVKESKQEFNEDKKPAF